MGLKILKTAYIWNPKCMQLFHKYILKHWLYNVVRLTDSRACFIFVAYKVKQKQR